MPWQSSRSAEVHLADQASLVEGSTRRIFYVLLIGKAIWINWYQQKQYNLMVIIFGVYFLIQMVDHYAALRRKHQSLWK